MRALLPNLFIAGAVAASLGCSYGESKPATSSFEVIAKTSSAITSATAFTGQADVARVSVTISPHTAGAFEPFSMDLADIGNQRASGQGNVKDWTGIVGGIPNVAADVTATAYDASDVALQTTSPVAITGGVAVLIFQADHADGETFTHTAPKITSITASAQNPGTSATVDMSAEVAFDASDEASGDVFEWSVTSDDVDCTQVSCGSFSNGGAAASTTWTAPADGGRYHIHFSVTDASGSTASVSFDEVVGT